MEVKIYKNKIIKRDLIKLLKTKYGRLQGYEYFLSDYKKALKYIESSKSINYIQVATYNNKELFSNIILINDKRIPKDEALFGFFETQNNFDNFRYIWDILINESKKIKIKKISGPINGSIWHPYRFIKKGRKQKFFISEPLSEKYYYKFFKRLKPSKEIEYYSAYRTNYKKVIEKIKIKDNILERHGFSIKVTSKVDLSQLLTIFEIIKKTFKKSWSYTELTKEEFLDLYTADKISGFDNKFYLLYKNSALIGFCTTFKDTRDTLICKTIGILPEYQGLGLGNALAYRIHMDAKKEKIKKIIYALIREGNKIQNFPKDQSVIFRKYSAFEFEL